MSYPHGMLVPALLAATGALAISAGCSHKTDVAAAPPPLEVEVAQVQQKDVPVYGEWIGTLDGLVNADIKAEVPGISSSKLIKRAPSSKGSAAFPNRSAPFPGRIGPGARSARADARPVGTGARAVSAVRGAGCGGGG